MVKKYTANLSNWLKSKLNSTASNSKMNGTQSAGVSDLIARADHVHPVDTSRAPTSHASSDTTYGVGSASNYGHVKVDSSPTDSSSNAVASGGVKTVLDTKQNEVETQAKITSFTNKDRINIERLINYMENGSGDNYYTLTLRGACAYSWTEAVNNAATTANLGVTNGGAGSNGGCCFVVDIRKNGVIQMNSSIPTVLKTVSGEKILDFVADSFSWASCCKYELANVLFGSTPGIHYVYAEATISGSVYKSNIIGVFVKDNNNLLDYNQWCADYDKNENIFYHGAGMKVQCSNEISSIGENSFKTIQIGTTQLWAEVRKTSNNTQFTGVIDVYNPNNTGNFIMVLTYTDNTQSSTNIYIPPSDVLQKDISCNIDAINGKTVSYVSLRVSLDKGYIDNLRLN